MDTFRGVERTSRSDDRRPRRADPEPGHPHALLDLQVAAGNLAVGHLLEGRPMVARASAAMGAGGQDWLRLGSSGPEVVRVQEGLNQIGTIGTPIATSGRFTSETHEVVRQFQTDSGIGVDGVVGPQTWEALDRHLSTTAETVAVGDDFHAGVDRPTGAELTNVEAALNPTSTGSGGAVEDWDGRSDPAKQQELRTELLAALQDHLDEATPHMVAREQAKAAGNVLSTDEQEGPGRAAKRYVDETFGGIASSAVLTDSQEAARGAFQFESGVNLVDASDPSERSPDPHDLAEWMADTDEDAQDVQSDHGFNRRRRGQGEPAFFHSVRTQFVNSGSNEDDLKRYDQFGFAFAEEGPRVLSQTAVVGSPEFSDTPPNPGEPSEAERRARWITWQVLVHEYLHTLAHPAFNRAAGDNRILTEGFCELFTKSVLADGGAVATAKSDGDPALRREVEGGDMAGFEERFVPDYSPGEYAGYLDRAEDIVAEVGPTAVRSAFFLGHIENIGLKPDGSMIDPTAPDADQHLAPEKVRVHESITSVTGLSVTTGAAEADIVSANPGLVPGGPLPDDAHTVGVEVPGTSHHRAIAARSRTQRAVETKATIAEQHGITEDALVRANPSLYHRQPREGEWVLIPVH